MVSAQQNRGASDISFTPTPTPQSMLLLLLLLLLLSRTKKHSTNRGTTISMYWF